MLDNNIINTEYKQKIIKTHVNILFFMVMFSPIIIICLYGYTEYIRKDYREIRVEKVYNITLNRNIDNTIHIELYIDVLYINKHRNITISIPTNINYINPDILYSIETDSYFYNDTNIYSDFLLQMKYFIIVFTIVLIMLIFNIIIHSHNTSHNTDSSHNINT